MSKLSGKNVLVIGGTDGVGEGVVKSFLTAGAVAIVPTGNQSKAKRLSEYVSDVCEDRLITIESNLSGESDWHSVLSTIQWRYKKLDVVIVSIGGWWQGLALHRVSESDWATVLDTNLTSHFRAGKVFLNYLLEQRQGLYVTLNSAASEVPVAGSGPVSVMAAARRMMTKVYAKENKDSPVRIHSLVINAPVITRQQSTGNQPSQLTAVQVGDFLVKFSAPDAAGATQVEHFLPAKKELSK